MKFLALIVLAIASAPASAAGPFFRSFHNVSVDTVEKNFNYYPALGYGARTLCVYRTGFLKPILAAGSFDKGVSATNQVTFFERKYSFGDSFKSKDAAGYRPREITAYIGDKNVNGEPGDATFNTLWERKDTHASAAWIGLSDGDFDAKWQEYVVQKGYRPADHFAYVEYGVVRHAVIFLKDGAGFYFFHGLTSAQFDAKGSELFAKGYAPASVNVLVMPNGAQYFSAIWMKRTHANVMYYGLSGDEYQQKFNELNAKGYHLIKIQGYNQGTQFAAIWEK